jgi:hypothetical protein
MPRSGTVNGFANSPGFVQVSVMSTPHTDNHLIITVVGDASDLTAKRCRSHDECYLPRGHGSHGRNISTCKMGVCMTRVKASGVCRLVKQRQIAGAVRCGLSCGGRAHAGAEPPRRCDVPSDVATPRFGLECRRKAVRFIMHTLAAQVRQAPKRSASGSAGPVATLTLRQREIMTPRLEISPRTVELHQYPMIESLGLQGSAGLIHVAIRHGILGP